MLKKLFTVGALAALISNAAFANAPYIGASLGSRVNTATDVNYRGVPIDIFGGYGMTIGEGIYLGGEILINVTTAEVTDNGLKSTTGIGIGFVPGLLLSDHTMGYFRLGVLRTKFSPSGEGNNSVTAGQFGVGIQTDLMQSWDLRGEYDYDAYGSLHGVSGKPRSDEFNLGLIYKFE